MAHIFNFKAVFSSIVSWILSVIFAYITNRGWVFEARATGAKNIFREIYSFFACRFATGALDCFIMFLCVDVFGFNDMMIKVISNVIVVVLNYVSSKIFVFKNTKN